MNSEEFIKEVKSQIAEGKILDAINLLREQPEYSFDSFFILIQSRFNLLEQTKHNGTIKHDDYSLSRNQLIKSLLHYLDKSEENNSTISFSKSKNFIEKLLIEVKEELKSKTVLRNSLSKEINQLDEFIFDLQQLHNKVKTGSFDPDMNQYNSRYFDKSSNNIDNGTIRKIALKFSQFTNRIVQNYGKSIIFSLLTILIILLWNSK